MTNLTEQTKFAIELAKKQFVKITNIDEVMTYFTVIGSFERDDNPVDYKCTVQNVWTEQLKREPELFFMIEDYDTHTYKVLTKCPVGLTFINFNEFISTIARFEQAKLIPKSDNGLFQTDFEELSKNAMLILVSKKNNQQVSKIINPRPDIIKQITEEYNLEW